MTRPVPGRHGGRALRIRWPRRYRGRPIRTLPDIATYQETPTP